MNQSPPEETDAMRWSRARLFYLSFLLPVLAGGCQPINVESNYTIPEGGSQSAAFTAPRYTQKIKVTVTPQDGPVSAYIVKDPDGKFGDSAPLSKPPAELIIAKRDAERTEEYTIDATIPAKTPYAILLYAKRKTDVKLKVTGR
jgi:hypothetical protein